MEWSQFYLLGYQLILLKILISQQVKLRPLHNYASCSGQLCSYGDHSLSQVF